MTLDRLLSPRYLPFWFAVLVCVGVILRLAAARVPPGDMRWRCVAPTLLAAPAAAVLAPDDAPWLVAGLFAFTHLAPAVWQRLLNWAVRRQDYPHAARLAGLRPWVVPLLRHPGEAAQRRLLSALALASRGGFDEAATALDALRHDPATSLAATAQLCRLRGDWSLLPDGLGEAAAASPDEVVIRLRALHDTGNRAGLVQLFDHQRARLGDQRPLATLIVLAGCGQRAAADLLLAGPLRALGPEVRAYWQAVAAGEAEGRPGLERLLHGPNRLIALSAQQRLGAPAPGALGPAEQAVVDQAAAALLANPPLPPALPGRAPVVLVLAGLNLAAYAAEILMGADDDAYVLFDLGTMWPPTVVLAGQWWRLATALFLHYGPVHLWLNLLSLTVFGAQVEARTGPLATLWVCAAAGLASTGGVLLLTVAGVLPDSQLAGASGVVMGLLGALLVQAARARRRRAAGVIVLLVLVQTGFDLLVPEVSLTAHLFGLAGGILAALAWRARPPVAGPALRRSRLVALALLLGTAATLAALVWRAITER